MDEGNEAPMKSNEPSVTQRGKKKIGIKGIVCLCVLFLCGGWLIWEQYSSPEYVRAPAPSISEESEPATLHASGVNTLISDSGVLRYHLVAEEWDIYTKGNGPATWKFLKGLLMERFDLNFRVDMFVQADTAYLHNQKLWELRGRVEIRNVRNEVFRTEELFWDMDLHEMYSHQFIRIETPERTLQGNRFRSNESMTRYWITQSSGAFPVSDTQDPATDDNP